MSRRMEKASRKLSPELLKPEIYRDGGQVCRVIVEYVRPGLRHISSRIAAIEIKRHRELQIIPSLVTEIPYDSLRTLARSRYIRRIWHDVKVRAMLDIAVPTVGGTAVQEAGYTGKGVCAAVIDTGIHPHSDLTLPENRIVGWNDLVNERPDPYDDNGHGSHVAGIIAGNGTASSGLYKGMAPEANLVGVKALDENGEGNTSDIIAAIEWCIQNKDTYNIKAINLSLGATAQDSYRRDPLSRAVAAAWNKGIVVCTAAGNDGPDGNTINTPGINPRVITVGNLDDHRTVDPADDELNSSSSRGPTIDHLRKPDVLAPGTEITSLKVPQGYRAMTGTSMSTPMITGAALQILQKWPTYQPEQVKKVVKNNTRSLGLDANEQGAGALNLRSIFMEKAESATILTKKPDVSQGTVISRLTPAAMVFMALKFLGLGI